MREDADIMVDEGAYAGIRMVDPPALEGFDLRYLQDAFYEDPFPWYHRLRRGTPVRDMPDGSILLTRHADLDRVYRDTKTFSSDKKVEFRPKFGDSLLYEHHTTSLVFSDPPLHTRVRRAIVGALAPRALKPLEPQVEMIVDRLVADIAPGTEFDAVNRFAMHLPIEIIGDLLCVPREERGPLRGWSLAILGALEPEIPKQKFDEGNRAIEEFLVYLEKLISNRRAAMTESDDDILSRLIRDVDTGDGLLHEELLHSCIFILNAGHETTTNLIASGINLLSRMPETVATLNADPTLWPVAIEEILRLESPNQLGNRRSVAPFSIDGRMFPDGTQITLCIGAANRDPSVFDNPDTFRLDRGRFTHFAFAGGPHLCAGMTVARIEGRVALSKLFAAFPGLTATGPAVRARRARFRGFDRLPMLAGT